MPNARALPEDLARYVVRQDYDRYDAADQATWRFVMLHLGQHLKDVAHPSYVEGLTRSALSQSRIPDIAAMDLALTELGWGAVCVDGFLPPRVFQRFQALSLLPIAADIRKPNHLAYTPAPDILHEAAGHAPILVNPDYAAYLRASGQAGEIAFSCPEDHDVCAAITTLSRVKELAAEGSPAIARAEQSLKDALRAVSATSEAAAMARLYWWTAEYGLIGTPQDFKLYGAGLLSSLSEAVTCLDPSVAKLPLSLACLGVAYDITQPQPQLFVTPSFAALFDVLEAATRTLAVQQGLNAALQAAKNSRLPCRLLFKHGLAARGTLLHFAELGAGASCYELEDEGSRQLLLLGSPDGTPADQRHDLEPDTTLALAYPSGVKIEGIVTRVTRGAQLTELLLPRAQLTDSAGQHPARPCRWLIRNTQDTPPLALSQVYPADDNYGLSADRLSFAPAPRRLTSQEQRLRQLYEAVAEAWRERAGGAAVAALASVHRELCEHFSDEWLLRWNLLEHLLQLGQNAEVRQLSDELLLLELRFQGREPIATGLRSLGAIGIASNDSAKEAS